MYYIIMYGSVLLGIVGLLIMGIGMVITSNDKVKLKPGQDRQTAVKNMRKQGKIYIAICVAIIALIACVVVMTGIEYIPGIGY